MSTNVTNPKQNEDFWNNFSEDALTNYQGPIQEQPKDLPTTDTQATGSGIDGALGMKYSWDTKAEDRAQLDYKSALLESKANYLTTRQNLETQGQQLQEQAVMQKYSQNQSNEKAGWTGGYVLDTERQMAYLKQSIQSQMYGQMELQKYGYETSLAAARLAYDTNKYDLALKYYNDAVSQALSEADRTGYYVSPEVKDHLSSYNIASKILEDPTSSDTDKQRASAVLDGIYTWFESNGISKQGVSTLANRDFILTLQETARSMAKFDASSNILKIDIDSYGEVDAEGNLQYSDDNSSVKVVNFNSMEMDKIVEYADRGDVAKQQVLGYLEGIIEQELIKTTEALKTKTVYKEDLETALNNSDIKKILDLYNTKGGADLLDKFSYSSKVLDKDITISLSKSGDSVSFSYTHNFDNKTTPEEFKDKAKAATNNSDASGSVTFTEIVNSKTELNNFTIKVEEDAIKDGKIDDDFDIDIGDKNYDLDVQWDYGNGIDRFWAWNNFGKDSKVGDQKGETAWAKAIGYLKDTYGTPTEDQLVVYADSVWFYSKKLKKWGYVQHNTGGNKLKDDLKTAMEGKVPDRWD